MGVLLILTDALCTVEIYCCVSRVLSVVRKWVDKQAGFNFGPFVAIYLDLWNYNQEISGKTMASCNLRIYWERMGRLQWRSWGGGQTNGLSSEKIFRKMAPFSFFGNLINKTKIDIKREKQQATIGDLFCSSRPLLAVWGKTKFDATASFDVDWKFCTFLICSPLLWC